MAGRALGTDLAGTPPGDAAELIGGPRPPGRTATLELLERCVLIGAPRRPRSPRLLVTEAETAADHAAYRALRRQVFVAEQGVFATDDHDRIDDDPRAVVLLARAADGTLLGGVRLAPVPESTDIGWWSGSRLVVAASARTRGGVGPALVRAACARAEQAGVVRFDATVQARSERMFSRLGWMRLPPPFGAEPRAPDAPVAPAALDATDEVMIGGHRHVRMHWPVDRFARLAHATKAPLGDLVSTLRRGGVGADDGQRYIGDDAAPVPGSDLVAACDAILPAMVERDPEWAGWCAVLVNVNDLFAMGARPVGLLDAVAARDAEAVGRVLAGLHRAAQAWGVPVLGGHTQLGVPAALSVTALGSTADVATGPARVPVAGGGAAAGQHLRLTADLGGGWRPGYAGAQWDSSSHRTAEQLRALAGVVPTLAPTAAKDVSMSGLVGTTGMLAEASGVKAVLDVAAVPRPAGASTGDWFTCFPGFAMVTAERTEPGASTRLPDFLTTARCGALEPGRGVELRWPDGRRTPAIRAGVTGLGPARDQPAPAGRAWEPPRTGRQVRQERGTP